MANETTTALWIAEPGRAELREEALRSPGPGEVLVETLISGVSRGTERLVFSGRVPVGERERMRAPFQSGEFPGPVKYGYMAVGRIAAGPEPLLGRTVFALAPHQNALVLPAEAVRPVPSDVPARRAVLAANMETALNVVWDGGIAPGDRVAVFGAGVVGLLIAFLAARIPGTETTILDIDPMKAGVAAALGIPFAGPDAAPSECDVAVNASASEAGLAAALEAAGMEATVVEASWYGDRPVSIPLGGAFHSRRLRIVGSQVSRAPPARRMRWPDARRLDKALSLLADDRLDTLLSGETPFADAATDYPRVLDDPATLAHLFRY